MFKILKDNYSRVLSALFFIFIAFLLFYGLDIRTLHLWDESRLAINTVNMIKSGNYWYTLYQNVPDFWNTKPHLLILIQTLSIKLFGFTEKSIRLPSAAAALLSSGLIYYWMRKENYSAFYACLAVMGFICSKFLLSHGARTGDYEALLILWQLMYCYAFFKYSQTAKSVFLCLGFISLILAVLTKGIAGLLFLPGITLFAFYDKKIGIFLKNALFYAGIIIFIFCIAGYYYLHELLTPGYLQSVYQNEIMGRYFAINEGHEGGIWFYFRLLSPTAFYFFPIWLIGMIYLFFNKDIFHRNILLQYTLILSLTFFIVISLSQTKLLWYSYPIYPFLGIATGILSYELTKKLTYPLPKLLGLWMLIAYISAFLSMLATTREKHDITFFIKNNFARIIPHDYKLIVDDPNKYDSSFEFQIEEYKSLTQHQMIKTTMNQIQADDWVIMQKTQTDHIPYDVKALFCAECENYCIYQIKNKK